MLNETAFERRRGVGEPEIRAGFAQVIVRDAQASERFAVLRQLADWDISLDFFKLTEDGMQFLVAETSLPDVQRALAEKGPDLEMHAGRRIVLIPAVNIRDEEGLMADLVAVAIGSGASISHLGDMHDRLLIVTDEAGAKLIAKAIQDRTGARS